MNDRFRCIWTGETLLPASDFVKTQIARQFTPADKVDVAIHRPKNIRHQRKFFKLLGDIADAIGAPSDELLNWCKEQTGRYDLVQMPDGSTRRHPRSIRQFDEEELSHFHKDCELLFTKLLQDRGVEKDDVRAAIVNFIGE